MKITENLYKVIVGDNSNNVYLLTGEKRAVLFDSGYEYDASVTPVLDLWEKVGEPDLAGIVVSHRHGDHSGGAARLSNATGAPIISSAVEKDAIENEVSGTFVTITVNGGEILDLGRVTIEFVFTPGHTVGSLSAYYQEDQFLFAGDTIRNNGQLFKVDAKCGDLDLHLDSLRKLQGYDIRLIWPGHGPEVGDPSAHIESELARLSSNCSRATTS